VTAADHEPHRVVCHLGRLLEERDLTLVQLAAMTGVTVANLSVLKNDRARATRFTTLTAICDALECQPGDLLEVAPHAPTPMPNDQGHGVAEGATNAP
jgi:putative transcriptional regulator